jgi:hypothetical protein
MAKIVSASLKSAKPAKSRLSVTKKRLKAPDGTIVTVRTIDADSPTFGDDLSYVFRQNVRRARRVNKTLADAPARVAAKA